jgi:hypothetical protein
VKGPSANIQAPEKLQISNNNFGGSDTFWSLSLGASLDVGAWDLELQTEL